MAESSTTHRPLSAQRLLAACAVLALALSTVVVTPGALSAQAGSEWSEQGAGHFGDGETDFAGYDVAISALGNRLAVSSPLSDGPASLNTGRVDILEWDGREWSRIESLFGENPFDFFGFSISMSADGNRLAIGAIGSDDNGFESGKVQIFEFGSNNWRQVGGDIVGEAAGDFSGASVSLSADGSVVALGATDNDDNGTDSGHVRILTLDGSSWQQVGDITGEAAGDFSGDSVSLSADGQRVAIGTPRNDGNGIDSGQARVYQRSGNSWVQVGGDIDGESANDFSAFAISLSASGDRLAVGAGGNDGNGGESGHVRVYDWNGNRWVQVGSDIDGEAAGDFFGGSLSLSARGDRLAVGAGANDGNGGESGHVRIYDWDGNRWVQVGPEINGMAANDFFGGSVALSAYGNRVAVGAPDDDHANGTDAGSAHVFVRVGYDPGTCLGDAATVVIADGQFPTTRDDVILGTFGDDAIVDRGGSDKICGLAGNDTIQGGAGDDTIQGGAGDDTIFGGTGNDVLIGNAGNDIARGGFGNDEISGSSGNDRLFGDGDNDTIFGNSGEDTINGGDGDDTLIGGRDRDAISGGDGNDTIRASRGADTVNGGPGNDLLSGQKGNDVLDGGSGNDQLFGHRGNDDLNGRTGTDICNGGDGTDTAAPSCETPINIP